MSRSVLFSCAATAALLASGPAAADQWERSFDGTAKPTVHVRTNDGRVQVVAGASGRVDVTVETKGWDIGREVKVRASQDGDRIEIEALEPTFQWSFGISQRSLVIVVHVPEATDLDLDSGDGGILVEGTRGALRAHTGDGRIEVDRVIGELTLTSGDGAITVEGADGSVFCKTSDGRIGVHGRFDGLHLESGDGRVLAEVEKGSALAEEWSITTGDGSMLIALPADLAADLDAQSGDGSIDVDVPVTIEGRYRRNHLHGTLNGGGPLLRIRTGDGAIRIERS